MKLPVIAVATLIVVITLIANLGAENPLLNLVQRLPGKDLTGHFVLYATLGFALSLCLRGTLKFDGVLIGLVAAAIVAEEFSQMFVVHRTFSISDLVASLTGFAFGVFAIRAASVFVRRRFSTN